MDRIVTTIVKYKIPNIIGRQEILKTIVELINNNQTFCIYGESGVGKSFLIEKIFENRKVINVDSNILKSRQTTLDFLENVKNSSTPIVIDEEDSEMIGWKEIYEHGIKSKGPCVIITQNIKNISFCDSIKIDPLPKEFVKKINSQGDLSRYDGNLRNYLLSSDDRDIFLSPKDIVHDLMCPSRYDPVDFIGDSIDEHGYSWGIVHENYIDSPNVWEHIEDLSDSQSLADVYDTKLYSGEWDFSPYFAQHAIIEPAVKLKQTLLRESMRPGSSWTKFNNYKMRISKYKEVLNKQQNNKTYLESLGVIRDYINTGQLEYALDLMKSYNIVSSDLDFMNHIYILNKIKPKTLQLLKKTLKK